MVEWGWRGLALLLAAATLPGTLELALVTLGAMLPARRHTTGAVTGDATCDTTGHATDVADPGGADEDGGGHGDPGAIDTSGLVALVPAHDEGPRVGRVVADLLACRPPPREVLVVADNCTDDTAQRARAAGARVLERHDPERRGKGHALAHAVSHLDDDVAAVLVLDADARVDPGAPGALQRALDAGATAAQARYGVEAPHASPAATLLHLGFVASNHLRPRGRERLGLSCGIVGNGFALSREALRAVSLASGAVTEDLQTHLDLVAAGHRVRFVEQARVDAPAPAGGAGRRTQRARWEGGRLHLLRARGPGLVRAVLGGDRRLLEPLLDLATLPLGYHLVLLVLTALSPWSLSRGVALVGAAVLFAHVLSTLVLARAGRHELRALASVPFYIAWKLARLPAVLAGSRRDARWVRTERDDEDGHDSHTM